MSKFDPKKFRAEQGLSTPADEPVENLQFCPAEDIERAAIIEHDGGIPREWAAGYAELLAMPCPEKIDRARWQRFLSDCGRFLDTLAESAASFGWKAHDLFSVAGGESFARVQLAGLLWLLNGEAIVALTADDAVIRTKSGAVQTYRRIAPQPGQQLAWELA